MHAVGTLLLATCQYVGFRWAMMYSRQVLVELYLGSTVATFAKVAGVLLAIVLVARLKRADRSGLTALALTWPHMLVPGVAFVANEHLWPSVHSLAGARVVPFLMALRIPVAAALSERLLNKRVSGRQWACEFLCVRTCAASSYAHAVPYPVTTVVAVHSRRPRASASCARSRPMTRRCARVLCCPVMPRANTPHLALPPALFVCALGSAVADQPMRSISEMIGTPAAVTNSMLDDDDDAPSGAAVDGGGSSANWARNLAAGTVWGVLLAIVTGGAVVALERALRDASNVHVHERLLQLALVTAPLTALYAAMRDFDTVARIGLFHDYTPLAWTVLFVASVSEYCVLSVARAWSGLAVLVTLSGAEALYQLALCAHALLSRGGGSLASECTVASLLASIAVCAGAWSFLATAQPLVGFGRRLPASGPGIQLPTARASL